ncbi:MAG: hypothetical protein ACI9AD_000840 [Nitriliruptoraceae bacterium]
MGQEINQTAFTPEDRRLYRAKVKTGLEVLRRMYDEGRFETNRDLMGVELEFHVVDGEGLPMHVNDELLAIIANEDFQTELAQFNIEFNLAPHKLTGSVFREILEELNTSYSHARSQAKTIDAHIMMMGTLPTVRDLDIQIEAMSQNHRYHMLNAQVLAARGEDIVVNIDGAEPLSIRATSITLEAAATSVQLHLQVAAKNFPRVWNAAQAIAASQVAVGANSPFFLGHELMQETRIAVFEQAMDTRTEELASQGVRPRVWFGERWIEHPLELFEENSRFFPALLPEHGDEDAIAVLESGGVPHLSELNLLNGTVYRWNRPIYGVARGKAHLRVENRVLPAGPTMIDTVANAAYWYGLVRAVADLERPISSGMSFQAAGESFQAAATDGIESRLFWPGVGEVPASELILRTLLPLAAEGLAAWNIDRGDRDRLLTIIEQRCLKRQTGASWQVAMRRHLLGRGMSPEKATLAMVREYRDGMVSGEPVHTWALP